MVSSSTTHLCALFTFVCLSFGLMASRTRHWQEISCLPQIICGRVYRLVGKRFEKVDNWIIICFWLISIVRELVITNNDPAGFHSEKKKTKTKIKYIEYFIHILFLSLN